MLEFLRAQLTAAREKRAALKTAAESVLAKPKAEARGLSDAEKTAVEAKMAELRAADAEIGELETNVAAAEEQDKRERAAGMAHVEFGNVGERRSGGARVSSPFTPEAATPGAWVRTDSRQPAVVGREQRMSDHAVTRELAQRSSGRDAAIEGQHGDLGTLIRSMSTTSASAIVPTMWAANIIDRARNMAAVLKAGAPIVPMDAKVVQIGRLTGDPTAAFRAEGSTITASDPTFDNVTLTANTMSALVVGSVEWFQDSINANEVVSNAIAKAVALQLDLAALFGGITSGSEGINLASPPNPRGILATLLAQAPGNVLGSGANGTAQTPLTYWNEVLDTIYTPQDSNEHPNGLIWNSKLARQYAKGYDSQGRPLGMPSDVADIKRFTSNQIPSFTQGTMTGRATDLFVGDFTQCLIGQRLDFTIQTLTERYAELGQVGILATFRGDVQLARPKAFSVYRYLQGA